MASATLSTASEVISFHHGCLWATVFKWRGHRSRLRKEHGPWLRSLSPGYRRRVEGSAVRVATFLYMFALSLRCPFDPSNALLAGVLAAVFDDLFDLGFETPEVIARLLMDPDAARCDRARPSDFLRLYRLLRSRMQGWQRDQLAALLADLATYETRLARGESWPTHWRDRGTVATEIFLTVLGVPESCWDKEAMGCFGEYFQVLDDYEDYSTDQTEHNFFRVHPEFDVDAYFHEVLAPALPRMFPGSGNADLEMDYDPELLRSFMETFHVFMVDFFGHHLPTVRRSSSYVYPWRPRESPLRPRGPMGRFLWYDVAIAATATQRLLPTPVWRPVTRLALQAFGWR
jgi:hypothetical protein